MVYEINGPMFFGAADKIPHIDEGGEKRVLILRMPQCARSGVSPP